MALTFTNFKRFQPRKGGIREGFVDITFDNSYPTGGEAVTAANLGLATLHNLEVPTSRIGHALEWDHVNGKIKAYTYDYVAVAAGPAIELPAASALLNGVVARCKYVGW